MSDHHTEERQARDKRFLHIVRRGVEFQESLTRDERQEFDVELPVLSFTNSAFTEGLRKIFAEEWELLPDQFTKGEVVEKLRQSMQAEAAIGVGQKRQ